MRRPITLVLTAALALAGALLTAAPAPAQTVGTVVNVSKLADSQAETAVAVNPTDVNDVVIASNLEFGYGIFVATSHDAGATWTQTVLGDKDRFGKACCDPTITWDRYGNLFLAWLGYGPGGGISRIPVAWSTNGGDSWRLFDVLPSALEAPATTSAGSGTSGTSLLRAREDEERGAGVDQPTITSGPRGVWAIWFRSGGSLEVAGARVRGPGDATPFGAARIVPNTQDCTFGDIAVGPAGQVAQVCQRDIAGSRPRRSVLRFNVDPDGFGPLDFTSGRRVARTKVSLFEKIGPQAQRTVDAEAGLAWDTSPGANRGRLSLVFTDESPDQSDDTDLWVRHTDDDGGSWSRRARIVQAANSQFLPRISLDRTSGHLVVGYHTAELDDGLGGASDTDGKVNTDAGYAIVFSTDGGNTWGTPVMVSQAPSNARSAGSPDDVDFGDYTGLAFVRGVAHPAWADNSNSTGDNPDGTLSKFDLYSAAVTEV